jgi:NAD(P)-dependent dehydrogenase (short-subunit alcohol dehydrogenase family)
MMQIVVTPGPDNQITKFLAQEFASARVRVNAIQPGFSPAERNRKLLTEDRVASIMKHTPMRRFGAHSEPAGAAHIWLPTRHPRLPPAASCGWTTGSAR